MARFGFTVTATRNKLSGGKATYAAHVQHLDVLRGKSLREEMASYFAMNSTLAGNLLNGLRGFIEHKLKACWRTLGSRFHASRSTIARHLQSLRQRGLLESVTIERASDVVDTYYRPT